MNLVTGLGGAVGILLGAVAFGIVIAVGLLPFVFFNRPKELKDPDEDRETRGSSRHARSL
jgi:hypothetical protein